MNKTMYASVTEAPKVNVDEGKHKVNIVQMIYVGRQKFSKGTREWWSPQLLIGFEFPEIVRQNRDGEEYSFLKSNTYFFTLNKSTNGQIGLRDIVEGVLGKELTPEEEEKFDVLSIVGKTCEVTIATVTDKNGKEYQNITSVGPSATVVPSKREIIIVTPDDFDNDGLILSLPEWIQNKIYDSEEKQKQYEQQNTDKTVDDAMNDIQEEIDNINIEDVPF